MTIMAAATVTTSVTTTTTIKVPSSAMKTTVIKYKMIKATLTATPPTTTNEKQ